MKAEIISIGTELLLGEITDTNASYLASQLPLLGIDLLWVTQVGDNLGRLKECLERAWGRSDIVITTGGLGPTEDDLTHEAIAAIFNEEPRVDPDLERNLREFFNRRKFVMPENNLKQAMLIPSARAIPNPRGSAPGWWIEKKRRGGKPQFLIAMPGPPAEMQRMWEKEVFANLRKLVQTDIIISRTIKTLTDAESRVSEKLAPLLSSINPSIGIYAKPDGIHLRITAKAASSDEARAMISRHEDKVRSLIGDIIWGYDDETLEAIIGKLLSEKGLALATMESCTGGLLASTITDVPGSSNYFKGGFVTYTNEAKIANGVDPELISRHGAVSPQVAANMARAARERLSADIGIGITGVAGPAEMEGKPAGTVFIAIDNGKELKLIEGRYPPLRHQVKRRAVYHALYELRKMLLLIS
ncbi:MAG: competence/damage-inducible protein A [Dehalococcoidia bacterium]|jgi:nicotinamide-nucleotide amidase